jgi:RNA polymerase sigma factor (sigma-70 family)
MAQSLSFQELLGRVRAGDQEAARDLVQRYEPAIRRAVRFRLTDSRLARAFDSMDICQSVLASFFLRVASGQFDLEKPEQLLTLLVAMARNKVALQVRAQQRQRRDYRRVQGDGLAEMQVAQADPSPSVQVAGKELLEKAERLMSAEERQLVELRKDGLDWDAIAEKLGGTPEALRKKLARAADRVARQLKLDTFSDEG